MKKSMNGLPNVLHFFFFKQEVEQQRDSHLPFTVHFPKARDPQRHLVFLHGWQGPKH